MFIFVLGEQSNYVFNIFIIIWLYLCNEKALCDKDEQKCKHSQGLKSTSTFGLLQNVNTDNQFQLQIFHAASNGKPSKCKKTEQITNQVGQSTLRM